MHKEIIKDSAPSLSAMQLAALVVENSGDYAILTSDLHKSITSWNPAAERLLGWRAEEAIGQSIDILFTPEDVAAGRPETAMRLAAEKGVGIDERWHMRCDGSRFWAVGQMTPLYQNGILVGYSKILRDRTSERMTEDQLRIAQQAGEIGTFELFPDTGKVMTSVQFCRVWGIPVRSEYNLDELLALIHPEDRPHVSTGFPELPRDALDYTEYRIIRRDTGEVRWLARRGEMMHDANNGYKRYLGVLYDITRWKHAEGSLRALNEQLRHSETQFRELAELAPAIVWFGKPDGTLSYLNSHWYDYTGQTPEEAIPNGWHNALHPDDIAQLDAAWANARAQGTVYETEARLRRYDGVYRWYLIRAQPQYDAAGRITGWLGVDPDIHDRKMAEIALQENQRRQQFLLTLGDRLRQLKEPRDILQAACEAIGRHLGVTRSGYAEVFAESGEINFHIGWSDGSASILSGILPASGLGAGNLVRLRHGDTLVFKDKASDPRTSDPDSRALHSLLDIRSSIVVPLVRDGQLRTIHFVNHRFPREWTSNEVTLTEEVARRTWDAVERLHAAQELERRVESAIAERDRIWRTSPDLLGVVGSEGRFLTVNPAVFQILGWTPDEFISLPLKQLVHPDDMATTDAEIGNLMHKGVYTFRFENRYRHKDGSYRWLTWTAAASEGRIYATARDITDMKAQAEALRQAEEALRQSQKMEAIGQLTGGIAHDFNNLLQGITAPLELMQRYIQLGRIDDLQRFIKIAMTSANRATALTHRLLAFSRRQPLAPRPVDANRLIASMTELLQNTMGESIQVNVAAAANLWITQCDVNQLENALLNLAINARDAMPEGGRLTVATANIHLDHMYANRHPDVSPGQYVMISISDTGVGMPRDVMKNAFDPFYTTKPIGQGTGLGLSMVYGFTKQSGGAAAIDSEEGNGTTVRIYLPRFAGAADQDDAGPEPGAIQVGPASETVLVVEDDPVVREMVAEVLREMNFRVLEAAEGQGALDVLEAHRPIHLLVTDVGLPGLNGRQIADAARQLYPDMKVLFMTGYAENAARGSNFVGPDMEMIAKPFSLEDFSRRVRNILEDVARRE